MVGARDKSKTKTVRERGTRGKGKGGLAKGGAVPGLGEQRDKLFGAAVWRKASDV